LVASSVRHPVPRDSGDRGSDVSAQRVCSLTELADGNTLACTDIVVVVRRLTGWTMIVLTLIMVVVACGSCVASFPVFHADAGSGPYRSPTALSIQLAGVVSAAILIVGSLIMATVDPFRQRASKMYLWFAAFALVFGGFTVGSIVAQPDEIVVTPTGFAQARYVQDGATTVVVRNGTHRVVTVCLGTRGDCAASPDGPEELRSPGVTLLPDHYIAIHLHNADADYRLTVIGTDADDARRDTVLHVEYIDQSA
jgi:hypothetical protein